jgi:hypothetical protein
MLNRGMRESELLSHTDFTVVFTTVDYHRRTDKVAGNRGISETKSKQQNPCSNCMHQPVTSWGNACSTCIHKPVRCMHRPVTSQPNACTYCMGSKVSSLSRIYLYSSYFAVQRVSIHNTSFFS